MPTVHYLWDELDDNVMEECDENGNVIAEYTHEPGLHGQLISQHRNGQTNFYHYDGMGNTSALTDNLGNVTDTYSYSAFGEEVAQTGSTTNPFGYAGALGYYVNPPTQDLYVRARFYAPRLGRWLSADPIGPIGMNLYEYASNNPLLEVDPSGLLSIVPRSRNLGQIKCGEVAYIAWDFYIDVPTRPGSKRKGAPCDGFIVQRVSVACIVNPCVNGQCSVDLEKANVFDYWEAWPVQRGQNKSTLRRRPYRYTDAARFTAIDNRCGYYFQSGEVKFFCKNPAEDPTGNNVGTGELTDWHDPTKFGPINYGPGECGTTSGDLKSKGQEPAFWNRHPVDGPAQRSFVLDWYCCECPGVKKGGNASASPS